MGIYPCSLYFQSFHITHSPVILLKHGYRIIRRFWLPFAVAFQLRVTWCSLILSIQQPAFYALMFIYACGRMQKIEDLPKQIIILCHLMISVVFYLVLGSVALEELILQLSHPVSLICTIE